MHPRNSAPPPRRPWLLFATLLALAAAAPSQTHANSTGITRQSGKQGTNCNQPSCHGDGIAPLVRFEGPTSVSTGALATFRFVVQSQAPAQTHAGLDVAVDAGTLGEVQGQGARILAKELTHTTPKRNDAAGVASFEFTWRAPETPGPQTLYGSGNSVNRNMQRTGDSATSTTLVVDVVSGTAPTATPSVTPTPTSPPSACAGDCDKDLQVTVSEIVTGVNIALGTAGIDACRAFDTDGDGQVAVNEIVAGVNAALGGCPR